MRRLRYMAVCASIAINVLAARMFYISWRRTYLMQECIRALSEQLGVEDQRFGYRVIYADDKFSIACDRNGSYLFHSQQYDEPVSLSFECNSGKSRFKGNHRCMVSTRNFFASWRIGDDKCDHVVFQYNDIGRKDDPEGRWDIRSSYTDRRLFFAENGYLKSQQKRLSDNGDDKNIPSTAVSDSVGFTDSLK